MHAFAKSSLLQGTAESPQVENKSAANDCVEALLRKQMLICEKKKKLSTSGPAFETESFAQIEQAEVEGPSLNT